MKVTLTIPGRGESSIKMERISAVTQVRGLNLLISELHGSDRGEGEICPHCGWTQQKCQETGFVGCSLCYSSLRLLSKGPATSL